MYMHTPPRLCTLLCGSGSSSSRRCEVKQASPIVIVTHPPRHAHCKLILCCDCVCAETLAYGSCKKHITTALPWVRRANKDKDDEGKGQWEDGTEWVLEDWQIQQLKDIMTSHLDFKVAAEVEEVSQRTPMGSSMLHGKERCVAADSACV